jgi:uncharacterized protein (TIGR00369 family)
MNTEISALKGTLPWTRSCFVCGENNPHGLRLRSHVENGLVWLEYTTREADRGYRHIVHGGILTTLLDEVMTWAAILAVRRVCVAAEITSRLKQPVKVGDRLRVEGWAAKPGKRLILTEGRITDEKGSVSLTAEGKYMPMPADQIELTSKDFVASPDAISPSSLLACHQEK